MKKYFLLAIIIMATTMSVLFAFPAFAKLAIPPRFFNRNNNTIQHINQQHDVFISGEVISKSGATLLIASRLNRTGITHTVDASHAVVLKKGRKVSLASIVVGDVVSVQGTANGTNITATVIRIYFKYCGTIHIPCITKNL